MLMIVLMTMRMLTVMIFLLDEDDSDGEDDVVDGADDSHYADLLK